MKKSAWAAAVVALGAAGYTGASWWFGQQIEEHYTAELDRVVPMLGTGQVVSHEYERGWFTSQARTVIELEVPEELFESQKDDPPSPPDATPELRTLRLHLQDDVRHGPLPGWRLAAATIASKLIDVEGVDDATRQAFANATAPSMNTVFGFDGRFDGDFVLPAGEMRHPQLRAQWQRFDAELHGTVDGDRVQGNLRWPQLTLSSEANAATSAVAVQMLMRGLTGEFTVEQPRDQPSWFATQGNLKGRIDEVAFRSPAGEATAAATAAPLLALNGITLDSTSALDGALLNMRLQLAAQGSVAGLKVDSLQFDSALDRLDTQAIAALQDTLPTATESTPPTAETQTQASVGEAIEQLLAAKPAYSTRLSATIGSQGGEIGYRLSVPGCTGRPDTNGRPIDRLARAVARVAQSTAGGRGKRAPAKALVASSCRCLGRPPHDGRVDESHADRPGAPEDAGGGRAGLACRLETGERNAAAQRPAVHRHAAGTLTGRRALTFQLATGDALHDWTIALFRNVKAGRACIGSVIRFPRVARSGRAED